MLLALDISTSCIGYSVFNERNCLIELDYIEFNSKNSLFEKLDAFKKKISHLLKLEITSIAIEEPLKKFKGKYSSANVISVLNFFNGMISSFLYNFFNIEPVYYNVKNARATVFPGLIISEEGEKMKHKIWENVMEMEPQINWIYGKKNRTLLPVNYDMADSYVIGKCFIKMLEVQKKINL
jgi:hypothetical protein